MLGGPVPSPGTRRWKVMGTNEVLVRQQANVCGNPVNQRRDKARFIPWVDGPGSVGKSPSQYFGTMTI